MKDYYRILQITPDASQEEIKKAFRRLAKVHHPDVALEVKEAVFIQDINEAYTTLSNPEKRSRYDWIRTNKREFEAVEEPKSQPSKRYKPFYKKRPSEGDIIKPYLNYTYTVSRVALLFALLLVVDFFMPLQQRSDKATYVIKVFSKHESGEFHDHTQLQTWSGRILSVSKEAGEYFEQNPQLYLYSTPILGKARMVAPINKIESGFTIWRSIYGNFVFFPVILLICAALGSLKRFPAEIDFTFGIASGILLLISMGLLVI